MLLLFAAVWTVHGPPCPACGKVYSLGGASLAFDSPDTSNYSDSATIASAAGTVIASGTITDVGGDMILQYNQTFTGTTGAVYACTYDNTSAINGSGLDASTSLIAWGGNGNNSFIGGAGNDSLTVGNGTNTLTDGDGRDTLTAGDGNNALTAGNGNDSLSAGNGTNTLTSGDGNDCLGAGNGNNLVTAGNGNDGVTLGDGSNTVNLGGGNDNVQVGSVGGNGNNTIVTALDGNDSVNVLGSGNNHINVRNGNDTVVVGNGNNSITVGELLRRSDHGRNGNNCIDFASGDVGVNLGNGNNTVRQDDAAAPGTFRDFTAGSGNNAFFLDAECGHGGHSRHLRRRPGGSHARGGRQCADDNYPESAIHARDHFLVSIGRGNRHLDDRGRCRVRAHGRRSSEQLGAGQRRHGLWAGRGSCRDRFDRRQRHDGGPGGPGGERELGHRDTGQRHNH